MTPPALSPIDTRSPAVAASATLRPLRILIVDDNHINLSLLSALLKRRFSHILDGPPVSVDSGLKAIQLLRTNVFDCILMDIQMPFLSGLETAKRIRASEDGILAANSSAHIVAVTTAVGDEPEAAYRRAGMDGMIGKPVKAHHLQHYLCPLAQEAHHSALSVATVQVGEESVLPPLPVASTLDRVFYLPSDAATPASRPSICEGADFEKLLRAQTRWSLMQCDARVLNESSHATHTGRPRKGTMLGAAHSLLAEEVADDSERESTVESSPYLRSNSSSSVETASGKAVHQVSSHEPVQPIPPQSPRSATLRISRRTLSKQIAREVANADLDVKPDEFAYCAENTSAAAALMRPQARRRNVDRPRCLHRISSPGWLLSTSSRVSTPDPGDDSHAVISSPLSASEPHFSEQRTTLPHRPLLSTAASHASSTSTSGSDDNDSGDSFSFSASPGDVVRRGSSTSTTSERSVDSEQSSTVTTPYTESLSLASSGDSSINSGLHHSQFETQQFCRKASSETIQLTLPERAWQKSDAQLRPTRLDEMDTSTNLKQPSHTVFAQRGLDAHGAHQLAHCLRGMELEQK